MADYLTPEARRRIAGGLMAAQYAENPPAAPMGYDFDAAPLSPSLMNFAAQRGQPGVIQKTLGLIPWFDQSGARGRQSWGNALMSTAQFPIDAVAGMGQAITAPTRAYRGEFDPTSEEGVGEALNVAGNAMMGGFAAPKPRNVVGSAGGSLVPDAAALDMSQAARMQRARGMVFDTSTPVYHATTERFDSFNRKHAGKNTDLDAQPLARLGPWFNDNPSSVADAAFSGVDGSIVIPAYLRGKIYDYPGGIADLKDTVSQKGHRAYRAELEKQGYSGLRLSDDEYGGKSTVAFAPRDIRSVNAGFDPEKSASSFLLAANGGRPGAATGAALGDPQSLNDPTLAEILRQYGIDVPSRPASPRYRPGDA